MTSVSRASTLAPPGGRFVVIQLGEGRVNNQITGPPHFQTKVDIVEGDRQTFLVESADLLENVAPGEQASARDRTVVARHLQLAADARALPRENRRKACSRDSADAEDHAGMLNRVVRVKQPRADRADFRPLHMFGHHGEPFAVDRFDVVVQKEQPGRVVCSTAKLFIAEKLNGPVKRRMRCSQWRK